MVIKISFNERGNYRSKVTLWARKVLQAKSFKVKMEVFLWFHVSQGTAAAGGDDVKPWNVSSLNRTCGLTHGREFKSSNISFYSWWGRAHQAENWVGEWLHTAKSLKISNYLFNSPTAKKPQTILGLILLSSSPVESEKVNSLGDYLQSAWKV